MGRCLETRRVRVGIQGPRKDLIAAYAQLQQYAVALENPPLLVACDRERFRIHTNFTNSVSKVYEIELPELTNSEKRSLTSLFARFISTGQFRGSH